MKEKNFEVQKTQDGEDYVVIKRKDLPTALLDMALKGENRVMKDMVENIPSIVLLPMIGIELERYIFGDSDIEEKDE